MAEEKREWLPASEWNDAVEKITAAQTRLDPYGRDSRPPEELGEPIDPDDPSTFPKELVESFSESDDRFQAWLTLATKPLYFPPDRRRVKQEFTEHYEERVESLTEHGRSLGAARKKAVEMLGSPVETGALLRQVHKPWLGWVLRLVRLVLVVAAGWLLLCLIGGKLSSDIVDVGNRNEASSSITVLTRRAWYCSDKAELGPWEICVEDVDFYLHREEVVYDDGSSEPQEYMYLAPDGEPAEKVSVTEHAYCKILISYTGMPWNKMNDQVVDRMLRLELPSGERYVNRSGSAGRNYYAWSKTFFKHTYHTGLRTYTTSIYLDWVPYTEEWLDLIFDPGDGTEKRLRIYFMDWIAEPGFEPEPMPEDAAAAADRRAGAMWEQVFLAEPETLWTKAWTTAAPTPEDAPFSVELAREISFRDDVEQALAVIEENGYDHLLPYEARDCVRMRCVLCFPGKLTDQPIDLRMLHDVLRITEQGADPGAADVEFSAYTPPDRYSNAALIVVEWNGREGAEAYALRCEMPGREPYTLTLMPGEEVTP